MANFKSILSELSSKSVKPEIEENDKKKKVACYISAILNYFWTPFAKRWNKV
jgi:hypothetical protein